MILMSPPYNDFKRKSFGLFIFFSIFLHSTELYCVLLFERRENAVNNFSLNEYKWSLTFFCFLFWFKSFAWLSQMYFGAIEIIRDTFLTPLPTLSTIFIEKNFFFKECQKFKTPFPPQILDVLYERPLIIFDFQDIPELYAKIITISVLDRRKLFTSNMK